MPSTFSTLAVPNPRNLVFGIAPKPVTCGFDLTIGGGRVYPEVNFTLPTMAITPGTWPQVLAQYDEIARTVLRRVISLGAPGVVLEFELLPPMTEKPEWGAEITGLLDAAIRVMHNARWRLMTLGPAELRPFQGVSLIEVSVGAFGSGRISAVALRTGSEVTAAAEHAVGTPDLRYSAALDTGRECDAIAECRFVP